MKIDLGFIFDLFRGVKRLKRGTSATKEYHQKEDVYKEERHQSRLKWMKSVVVEEIAQNVRTTINEFGLYEKYGDKLNMDIEELCLEISLYLDEETYTKIEIRNAFDSGIACSTGVDVGKNMLDSFAEYYYSNFYSDEKQMQYHKEGQERRAEAEK